VGLRLTLNAADVLADRFPQCGVIPPPVVVCAVLLMVPPRSGDRQLSSPGLEKDGTSSSVRPSTCRNLREKMPVASDGGPMLSTLNKIMEQPARREDPEPKPHSLQGLK